MAVNGYTRLRFFHAAWQICKTLLCPVNCRHWPSTFFLSFFFEAALSFSSAFRLPLESYESERGLKCLQVFDSAIMDSFEPPFLVVFGILGSAANESPGDFGVRIGDLDAKFDIEFVEPQNPTNSHGSEAKHFHVSGCSRLIFHSKQLRWYFGTFCRGQRGLWQHGKEAMTKITAFSGDGLAVLHPGF